MSTASNFHFYGPRINGDTLSSRVFERFCLCPTVVSFCTPPKGIVLSRVLATERFLFRITLNGQNTPVETNLDVSIEPV